MRNPFQVGQKGVCVEANEDTERSGIAKGNTYTVSAVEGQFVYIAEADPKGGWYHWRFKPVVQKKTDISMLKKLLEPSHV